MKGKDYELDILIAEIIEEHLTIKKLIEDLDSSDKDEEKLNDLGIALENHIRKEERVLFQKIQLLFKDELNQLDGKIISVKDSCKI